MATREGRGLMPLASRWPSLGWTPKTILDVPPGNPRIAVALIAPALASPFRLVAMAPVSPLVHTPGPMRGPRSRSFSPKVNRRRSVTAISKFTTGQAKLPFPAAP